ncbi:MAG: tyrosine-type recombinase/integrase [Planctomycetota bacterium]|jgi:integrase|nr:tyrosine-type recombinase/integrase [Planctomycetota bacterium]
MSGKSFPAVPVEWTFEGNQTNGRIAKEKANIIRNALAAAFAERAPYPDEIKNEPAIIRYIAAADNIETNVPRQKLIEKYVIHLQAKSTSIWPRMVRGHLSRALGHFESLTNANTVVLQEYLDIITTTKSAATRNKTQAALSGFYRWLRNSGPMPKHLNPMQGIQKIREPRPVDGIIIWEADEVRELLEAANSRHDGIAVWIAILAGLRRGEIARLQREDVTPAYINVAKSKNGDKRQVSLSKTLADRLAKEERQGRGFVVACLGRVGYVFYLIIRERPLPYRKGSSRSRRREERRYIVGTPKSLLSRHESALPG